MEAITRTFYRVVPESHSMATEDFRTLEEAIKRANQRNTIRIDTTNSNDDKKYIWGGANCTVVEVTEVIRPMNI